MKYLKSFKSNYPYYLEHAAAQLVEALRYKPEGRGFEAALWPLD
jgi:hypothetical protein